MPELPEVETVKRGLSKLIIGKEICSVDYDWPKSFPNSLVDINSFLIGASIVSIRRRAKVLIIDLDTKYSLVIHLKMTGQIVYRGESSFAAGHPNDSMIGRLPDRSTRVTFDFLDGDRLFFNDQRKFGWVRLIPTVEVPNLPFMLRVGPEPLSSGFTDKVFIDRIRRRQNTTVKAAILDQTVLAGVGNIYADEALWGARIYPGVKVKSLSNEDLSRLHKEIIYVMKLSIEKGGSTDRNYVDAEGKRGSYLQFARVFRREGQPCLECGNIILKTRVANRGTHYCPVCQKEIA